MNLEEIEDFVTNGYKHFLPHNSIDCVIFGYHEQQLKVLIGKWRAINGWGFPGGFIGHTEPLTKAAKRILKDRTSLEDIFLQQFYTFGDSDFRLSSSAKQLLKNDAVEDNWLMQRTLSVGYYALIDYSKLKVKPDMFIEKFKWQDISKIPKLLFDHNEMLIKALSVLRSHTYYQPIGYNLLPDKFTMPEIQSLYETILDKKLDRRNFPKRLLSLGILKKLDEKKKIGAHRSPYLYEFDREKYENALIEGVVLSF